MTVLLVIVGVVLLAVIWALVAANSGKVKAPIDHSAPPPPPPAYDLPDEENPKARSWQDARTASVSKNFGRGGAPTGVSKDYGKVIQNADEDFERLKKARAFEPRVTSTNVNVEES